MEGDDLNELVSSLSRKSAHERALAVRETQVRFEKILVSVLARGSVPTGAGTTQTERLMLAVARKGLNISHAVSELVAEHSDGPPQEDALKESERLIGFVAYAAGRASALMDVSKARKSAARTRSTRTNSAVQAVDEAIEHAARSAGSAAGQAEKLAPKLSRSTSYLERRIRDVRKRLRSGHE